MKGREHPFAPGTIFVCRWGYEQTNADFYEVTVATKRTVMVRELLVADVSSDSGGWRRRVAPLPGGFVDGSVAVRKLVQSYRSRGADPVEWYLRMPNGSARVWDRVPVTITTYG